jgi:MscS family membrane protein
MTKQFTTLLTTLLLSLILLDPSHAAEIPAPVATPESQPILKMEDELHRDTPRSTITSFFEALDKSDFATASQYLDFRHLPRRLQHIPEKELTRKFKIILDRATWIDLASLSNNPDGYSDDNLPSYREFLARVELDQSKSVDILLQKIPGPKGFDIWKFSNRTVAKIPAMYDVHGYTDFEQRFVDIFPEYEILGWQIWQWIIAFVVLFLLFIALSLPLYGLAHFFKRKKTALSKQLASLMTGPLRLVLLVFISANTIFYFVTPSSSIRSFSELQTLRLLSVIWLLFSLIEMVKDYTAKILEKKGLQNASVLLRPARTMVRISIIILVGLIWLDNMGVSIATALTGLGVGGLAFALAAQDTLKNLIGSVIIFLDKPFAVGERIIVAGHDGEVEEMGLRSTKLRLLTGHQTIIPNELMARTDIENVDRRPHIRRLDHISLPYDTPLNKVKKAVEIIRKILDNHEGMAEDKPAQVYFESFKDDHLSIVMYYWYHPALYWEYLAFNQKVNEAIMAQFEAEGISFALPAKRVFMQQ